MISLYSAAWPNGSKRRFTTAVITRLMVFRPNVEICVVSMHFDGR